MDELNQNEQYFFDEETLSYLSKVLLRWDSICCLCTPLLGQYLAERRNGITILDIDTRFDKVSGFKYYDLSDPKWLDEKYDLIICDPPFFGVSFSNLIDAIRKLSHYDLNQKLMICIVQRRSGKLLEIFSEFGLLPTGYFPTYQTVNTDDKTKIEFFSNLSPEEINSEARLFAE